MMKSFMTSNNFYKASIFNFGIRTNLFNYQKDILSAQMVNFCGFDMPIKFKKTSIIEEHIQCRTKAAAFDVSHMGQIHIHGKDRIKFLESICTGDVKEIKPHHCLYSVLLNQKGGVIDDFIISKMPNYINIVVNGGTKVKDLAYINKELEKWSDKDVRIDHMQDNGMIALQGPLASKVLQKYVKESLKPLYFMQVNTFTLPKVNEKILLRRSGYTGEDGFEISVSNKNIEKVYDMLLHESEVKPTGLGARDTLRLEAGMCLYGHELNENISPIEAGLVWAIGKRRRKEEGSFPAYSIIKAQMKKGGVSKKRVGLTFGRGGIPRENTPLCDKNGTQVGIITSGTFSPTLRKSIALGYVPINMLKINTPIFAKIRNNLVEGKVSKLPFVANQYYREDAKI